MKPTNYKVLLADDHILFRDALVNLINNFPGFTISSVAANGKEVVKSIESGNKPDIILLDLNMPEMDGYQTSEWLSKQHPTIKILILTMYDTEIALIRMLQDGVRGFLKKDIHPNDLKYALESVAEDGYYYSASASNKLAALFKKDRMNHSKLDKSILTGLEIEFLKNASSDMTYKEIAIKMNLTTRVVDNYRDALFEKLEVKSRVGLAIYAVKNGIITF